MATRTLPTYPRPRCLCGAARRAGAPTCRKCRARERWLRRSSGRRALRPASGGHRPAPAPARDDRAAHR